MVNSALSADEMRKLRKAQAKLLYVAPERFANDEFMEAIRSMEISLLVVDEAHCISEWGHSFRPSYMLLPNAIERLGRPAVLALTATATPWIRNDIVERLGLREPTVVVRGVDRPNLFFEVRRVESEEQDRRMLQHLFTDDCDEYPAELAPRLCGAMEGTGAWLADGCDGLIIAAFVCGTALARRILQARESEGECYG